MYQLNLMECLQGEMTSFEILVLIRGLGLGSRFVAKLQGGEQFIGWDVNAYQLASVIDAVNNTTYVVTAANSGKRKPKAPKPTYRPSKTTRKSNNMFRTQLEQAKQRKARGG